MSKTKWLDGEIAKRKELVREMGEMMHRTGSRSLPVFCDLLFNGLGPELQRDLRDFCPSCGEPHQQDPISAGGMRPAWIKLPCRKCGHPPSEDPIDYSI